MLGKPSVKPAMNHRTRAPSDNALIIARITQALPEGLETKGDNNPNPYPYNITTTEYVGKIVRIDNPP